MGKRVVRVGTRNLAISSEDKIMFPKARITKGQLIEYYQKIAPQMIPYMRDRPLTLQRFPDGITGEGFYQKEASSYFPSWIHRVTIKNMTEGATHYVFCNDVETLVYLTNQSTITYHLWLSTIAKRRHPDRMIFDLDPSQGVSFAMVRWVAKKTKELLDLLDLPAYAMLTGSRGVHIVVPLKPIGTYERVHQFAYDVGLLLSQQYPKKITITMRKADRGKRVFVDYLRNTFAQTGVAPYSVRANDKAAVATPVAWDELFNKPITSQQYTIKNIFKRIAHVEDPWADMSKNGCTLSVARKRLTRLMQKTQQDS